MSNIIGTYYVAPACPICLAPRSLNIGQARSMRSATVRRPERLSGGEPGARTLLRDDAT
jgi:hypothetical protein